MNLGKDGVIEDNGKIYEVVKKEDREEDRGRKGRRARENY